MSSTTIALVGDHSERHAAHRAIPLALEMAKRKAWADVAWEWVATRTLNDAASDLKRFSAVWLVPASPYENMAGALGAVRFARESGRPFLGTCGGFQHALIEIARNAAGLPEADHGESNPDASVLVVEKLSCSLVEKTGTVVFAPGSRLEEAYNGSTSKEEYRCSYGFNPKHRAALEKAGMAFTALDDAGEIRGGELSSHPFFVGVLFQPERAALRGDLPPLVTAFVRAAIAAG